MNVLNNDLESWIRGLAEEDKLYVFYKSREWLALREEVMSSHHYECEACLSKGIYHKAETIHHEFPVKIYPKLALTRWIDQIDGTKKEVLHPLCNKCHNEVHNRFQKSENKFFLREEIW